MSELAVAGGVSPTLESAEGPGAVIGRYAGRGAIRRYRRTLFTLLTLFAVFYGFAWAVVGRFLLVQLLIPLVVLAGLVIWLLPDTGRAPERLLQRLFIAFLFAFLCWPDYLAIALPGLPWITAVRLVGIPMSFVLLICVSVSAEFRTRIADILSATPVIWKLLVVFTATAVLSLGFSAHLIQSLNKLVVAQMAWTAIFFISVLLFAKQGFAFRFSRLLWIITIYVCLIGLYEAVYSKLPWAGRVPSFLAIEDPAVQRVLAGLSRASTGVYRVQSKFGVSLGLGEFFGLVTPFIVHMMMTTRSKFMRIACAATLPLIFYIVIKTDSRLAAVGFLMAGILYALAWGIIRWRSDRTSLFGPAIILAYPALFVGFIFATFFVGRLRVLVWGSGQHVASTTSRQTMVETGLPLILQNPLGYGISQGAETLGFTNPGGILTIDVYYLTVALEYGVIGFFAYFGMYLAGIWYAGKTALQSRDPEIILLMPACIALINFVISKSVFSQQENHSLAFMLLGMVVALVWRHQQAGGAPRTK